MGWSNSRVLAPTLKQRDEIIDRSTIHWYGHHNILLFCNLDIPYIETKKKTHPNNKPFLLWHNPNKLIFNKEEVKGNTRFNCILLHENGNRICTQNPT
jgi:hypothetical protein